MSEIEDPTGTFCPHGWHFQNPDPCPGCWSADLADDGQANTCTHMSATGIDTTPVSDPSKVWRCDHCGLQWTQGPDGSRMTPAQPRPLARERDRAARHEED